MHLSTVKSILNISCVSSKCLIYDTEVHMLILYDEKDIKKEGMQEQMYNPPIFFSCLQIIIANVLEIIFIFLQYLLQLQAR